MQTCVPVCTSSCVDHHSLQPPNPISKHKTQNKISLQVASGNDSESPICSSDEMPTTHTGHPNKTCTSTSSCTDSKHHFQKQKLKNKQISPKSWEQLNSPSLQALLPKMDNVTYVVESYHEEDQLRFEEAPKFSYHLKVRINLENEEQAKKFLNQMMEHSFCTYRITRMSKKPAMKRVAYKIEMHCQHFRKGLSKKDKENLALSQSKKAKKPLTLHVRNKKTQCPSRLTLTGKVPTKKQLVATNKAYLKSHKAILKISFNHNHPITSAYALSFRTISAETRQKFFELFNNGHSASSARHIHEQHLLMDAATDEQKQYSLADRALNPSIQDISNMARKKLRTR